MNNDPQPQQQPRERRKGGGQGFDRVDKGEPG
jgi:hypothetical protein